MAAFRLFRWLSSIPPYLCTPPSLTSSPWKDTLVLSSLRLWEVSGEADIKAGFSECGGGELWEETNLFRETDFFLRGNP